MKAVLSVRLTPRAGRNEVAGVEDSVVLARVSAAPVKGAANAALCELIAGALHVPKSAVTIRTGATGRLKTLEIDGIDTETAQSRLDGKRVADA